MSARSSGLRASLRLYRPYVADLANVVDMDAIRDAGVKIAIDPLGAPRCATAADHRALSHDATILNDAVDPTFRFMTVDWDGKIGWTAPPLRDGAADRSARQVRHPFANDTEPTGTHRHPLQRLMNPNHYLAAAIAYCSRTAAMARRQRVARHRLQRDHDRVAGKLGRKLSRRPSASNGSSTA